MINWLKKALGLPGKSFVEKAGEPPDYRYSWVAMTPLPRSSKWPAARASFIKEHQECAACGTREDLDVHHVVPFHVDPSLELEHGNLITLCRADHLIWGHFRDWKAYNPQVREDAEDYRCRMTEARKLS